MIYLKILFKNNTKYTKEIYNEFLEFHKNKFTFTYTLYTAIVMISIFFCIALQVKYHYFTIAIILCFALTAFFLWRFLHPISEVSKQLKSDVIQKEKKFTFIFCEKCFKIRSTVEEEYIKYRKLYKIYETDTFFYLYIDKTHSFLIDKSKFTKGTPIGFSNFIKKNYWWKYKRVKSDKAN